MNFRSFSSFPKEIPHSSVVMPHFPPPAPPSPRHSLSCFTFHCLSEIKRPMLYGSQLSHQVTRLLLATNLRQTGKSVSGTVSAEWVTRAGRGSDLGMTKPQSSSWRRQKSLDSRIKGQRASTSSWLGTGRNAIAPVALYWIMIASQIIFWKAQGDSPTVK